MMFDSFAKAISPVFSGMVAFTLLVFIVTPAFAETHYKRVYDYGRHEYVYLPERTLKEDVRHAFRNPVVKQAAIGAAIGTATGLLSDRTSIVRGAAVGGLVGAGTGWLDKSGTLNGHPVIKTAVKGAAIGTGAGIATRRSAVKGALVGGAAGTGWHYLKRYLNNEHYYDNNN